MRIPEAQENLGPSRIKLEGSPDNVACDVALVRADTELGNGRQRFEIVLIEGQNSPVGVEGRPVILQENLDASVEE